MHFKMSSALCFNLGQSKILLSGNGLKGECRVKDGSPSFDIYTEEIFILKFQTTNHRSLQLKKLFICTFYKITCTNLISQYLFTFTINLHNPFLHKTDTPLANKHSEQDGFLITHYKKEKVTSIFSFFFFHNGVCPVMDLTFSTILLCCLQMVSNSICTSIGI